MSSLELEASIPKTDLGRNMRLVLRHHGKGFAAQAKEMLELRLGQGRISPQEYYYFSLYNDDRFSREEKRRFVGRKIENRLHYRTNRHASWGIVTNKLVSDNLLSSLGFPVPKLHALYRASTDLPNLHCLQNAEELANYLRRDAVFPFFSKPVEGIRSIGVSSVGSYDPKADQLICSRGRGVDVTDFVKTLGRFRSSGYIFQERLKPHPNIVDICGDRLATVRVIVLLRSGNRPEVYRALWKIPAGQSVADNFWRGNLITAVDLETGRARRPMMGTGLEQREVDDHPDTNASLTGVQVPLWHEIRSLALQASTAIPGLSMQAWDVAATTRGPVLIEVNVGGDYNLPQLAWRRGALDEQFMQFLKECSKRNGWPRYRKYLLPRLPK